ncbi:MAG: cupin domain-containing protein [Gammaproteobacteria bacterium]
MTGESGLASTDVRILRHTELDSSLASQRLAEITHLPTGVASDQLDAVTVPPGEGVGRQSTGHDDTLLHVVAGSVRVHWGERLERVVRAGPGDTVLVPAGTEYRADNGSSSVALQLIRVHGG